MALIIGGITAIAAGSYAIWKRIHGGDLTAEIATASRIRLGADLVISVARACSWVSRLFSGEVLGPLTTPGQREPSSLSASTTSPTGRTIPLRIGHRAGDLEAEAG